MENVLTTLHHQQKNLIVLHQRETRMAQVLQEASRCFLHWDDGCASSMCVEKLVETAVARLLGTQVPADLQMHEAGQDHGLWTLFSLVPCQVVGGLHQSKTLDFQNLKNMRLHDEIPVRFLKQQILAEEGPLLYLYFPLLKGSQTGQQLQVSKQYRTDFFQNNQVLLHHKAP